MNVTKGNINKDSCIYSISFVLLWSDE